MDQIEVRISNLKYAANLRKIRRLSGLRQIQVANHCGIEQGNYSRMEQGMLNFNPKAKEFIIDSFEKFRINKIIELQKEIRELMEINI